MNSTWRFHYGDYAIGENEQLYERMAGKGWELASRGAYLSRFRRAEPRAQRYRIELSSPAMLEDQDLPEEQVALYEDCGWKLVTSRGLVHVFTAPEDCDRPELYSDPRQQAGTLKALRRSYWLCWIIAAAMVGLQLLFAWALAKEPSQLLPEIASSLFLALIRTTFAALSYACFVLLAVFQAIYGGVRTALLHRRLRAGKPLDHCPKRRIVHDAVFAVLLIGCIACGAGALVQLCTIQRCEMPLQADGPYLVLGEDLGIEGERGVLFWQDGEESEVEVSGTPLARMWCAHEDVDSTWLYQDVYRLRSEALAPALVQALMYDSTFAGGPQDYEPLSVEGLDAAWACGLDGIAVKGKLVCYMTYSEGCSEQFFAALAEKLGR